MSKGRAHDLTGQRFARLVVLSRAKDHSNGSVMWSCQCDCGGVKDVTTVNLRKGCTRSCGCLYTETHTKPPIALRFWDSVAIGEPDQCWEWQAALITTGYGILRIGLKNASAHRTAWALHHGREPELQVHHHCDNRKCCNPSHLYEGTQARNIEDMIAAGRNRSRYTGPMTTEEDLATRGLRQSFN